MKKKLILLSLIPILGLTSCGVSAAHDTFFKSSYMENLNLYNMPTLDTTNTRLLDSTSFYYTTTEEDFNKYASDMFKYLIERESMKYVLYKGENRSNLLDDKYNQYNVYSSKNIDDYKIDKGYQFIFSFTELNSDTSLSMAFCMTLEYYEEPQTNEHLEKDFTYNAMLDISGIDKPQYLFYTIKE